MELRSGRQDAALNGRQGCLPLRGDMRCTPARVGKQNLIDIYGDTHTIKDRFA
jgi:hypothetical protein